ncbi:Decaprenyl diphosphate synthase-like protein [Melampsora americana]|nr:Decaprenyl diphosphate synthase-like protein [Melampsora americana]
MIQTIKRIGPALLLTIFFGIFHVLHLFTHATRVIIACGSRLRDILEDGLVLTRLKSTNSNELSNLKKKPNHIAIIWVPINTTLNRLLLLKFLGYLFNRPSSKIEQERRQDLYEVNAMTNDLHRLITWAKVSGVQELSFYDERGLLKKYQYDVLESLASTYIVGVRDSVNLITTNQEHGVDQENILPSFLITYNVHGANSKPKQTLRLNLLTRRHGHEHLVQVTRQLVNTLRDKSSSLSLNDLNLKIIGEKICSTSIGPPDLIMVLGGRSLRFRGFPPWQLNLTEIYHGRSYSILPYRVTYREFMKAMKVYSDCEQRKGA